MPTRVAIIMAGGAGERFWPLSRRHRPKQLLRLIGQHTLLEESVERIAPLTGYENIYVATGADQAPLVEKILPRLPADHVLREPMGRDTSGCLALALAFMSRLGGDPTMAVLTADHRVSPPERFHADCRAAFEQAESEDVLLTFGVQPERPETGFGYIELGKKIAEYDGSQVFEVRRFREKPNAATARMFLEAGNYLWNSGMFVWRCSVLRQAMVVQAPFLARASDEMAAALGQPDERARLARIFERLPKISIDFTVMERASNVRCVRATFQWDDIGAWSALARHHPADESGNVVVGKAITLDTARSILWSGEGPDDETGPLVVTLGVKDLVVVVSADAVLVCHRDQAQRIKEIIQKVRETYGERYC